MLTIGTKLGRFVVTAPLGAGGMGEVYRATDTLLGREVAIKVLPEEFAFDSGRLARFEREVKALAILSHNNILIIYDYGFQDSTSFAVTELLEGETLRTRLLRSPLPWRSAVEVTLAVADGLATAHAQGIVHRDLKPENLFLTAEGGVKILDFGLAAVGRPGGRQSETAFINTALTEAHSILGTIGYMAPEQLRGLAVDGRADLFSLGCVLYEMMAGTSPFRRGTIAETNAAVLRDEPRRLGVLGIAIPAGLEALICHCLEKDPEQRVGQARVVASTLLGLRSAADRGRGSGPVVASGTDHYTMTTPSAIDSIAVLPFMGLTDAAEHEVQGEEIAEGILARLSELTGMRVTARVASFRFRGRDADPQVVGRALGVRAVLAGRLLMKAESLVVRVELVATADGSLLWGAEYRSSPAEILDVESNFAEAISDALRGRIGGWRGERHLRHPAVHPAAHRLFRQGRSHLERRTEDDFRKAGDCFRRAIDLDPGSAPAYAGLADLHVLLGAWGSSPPRATFPTARQMAEKAIELDPDLADAHAVLGFVAMAYEWDWIQADAALRRAIELNPNHAIAHARLGYLRMLRGRLDEALTDTSHAQRLNPISPIIRANVGFVLYYLGRFDDALTEYQAALAMNPRLPSAYCYLGWAYEELGDLERAIIAFQHAVEYSRGVPDDILALSHAYCRKGLRTEAETAFRKLLELATRRYVSSALIGTGHLALGRLDEGYDWLERAVQERDYYLIYFPNDPRFAEFRSDPRFVDLVARIERDPYATKL